MDETNEKPDPDSEDRGRERQETRHFEGGLSDAGGDLQGLGKWHKAVGVPLNDPRSVNVCLRNVAGCLPLIPLCGRLPGRME